MTEVLIHNFEYIMKVRERVILSLFAVIVFIAAGYGYFMEKTIVNTVALKADQSSLARESQVVSGLSAQYVAADQNLTMDAALAQGFAAAPVAAFISVSAEAPVLSINAF